MKLPMKNAYLQKVYADVLARDPGAVEFHQCIREFLESIEWSRCFFASGAYSSANCRN